jgi:putative flippase GtrA
MKKLKLDKATIWSFIKYLLIGGSAFVVEYLLFLLLRTFLHYILANVIVYTIMFWCVFLANKYINFKIRDNFLKQLLRYTILYFINLVITNLLLYLLSEYFMVDTAIGKFFVSGVACLWNFALYKLVIYKD